MHMLASCNDNMEKSNSVLSNRTLENTGIHRCTSDSDVDCRLAILGLIWRDGVIASPP